MKTIGIVAASGAALCVTFVALIFYALYWPYPSRATQQSWEAHSKALVPGYSDFRGHWLDADIPVYIYSYRCPNPASPDGIFSTLARQLVGLSQYERSQFEVAFRHTVGHPSPEGLDEYRFIYSPDSNRLFVLDGNLDIEKPYYHRLVEKLRAYARATK